jgi:hypothetical protein
VLDVWLQGGIARAGRCGLELQQEDTSLLRIMAQQEEASVKLVRACMLLQLQLQPQPQQPSSLLSTSTAALPELSCPVAGGGNAGDLEQEDGSVKIRRCVR